MGFFVVGVNHKACPVQIREKLHFRPKQIAEALQKAKSFSEIEELVILSTCNRVEFYGYSATDALPLASLLEIFRMQHPVSESELVSYLYRYENKDAIRHLFRVVAGLDSLVVGENEILGQVRTAYQFAIQQESVDSLLYRLMEKAIKVGKNVRTQTRINEGAVSIPSVAVELAEKIFGHLNGEKVMVLGAGEMSVLALDNLKEAGANICFVASRREENGREIAERFVCEWVRFEAWEKCLADVDILIASTSAPHAIVSHAQIKKGMSARKNRPLLLMDIAVPRNMEASINQIDDVFLYNVDDLKGVSVANLRLRKREIRAAEEFVNGAILDYQGWFERLKARPVLESFEGFLDQVLTQELERVETSPGLTDEKKQEIHRRIRAKILHGPHQKIKEASQNGGVKHYLEAIHSLFDLDKKS